MPYYRSFASISLPLLSKSKRRIDGAANVGSIDKYVSASNVIKRIFSSFFYGSELFCTSSANIFYQTPAQLTAIQRKVEKEEETLEQQPERVSPGMQPEASCAP